MPLAFDSKNHGKIAFGFFNIESDMLLLEHYFFFASDFCSALSDKNNRSILPGYIIEKSEHIGDLHGAIAGTHFSGFIGEIYKKFPFPKNIANFKQQSTCYKSRSLFENLIQEFATPKDLVLGVDKSKAQFSIGSYEFTQATFLQLIDYVIQGGYPKWQDGIAPDYVSKLQKNFKL
ncbi:MAG: hypothetical protein DRQ47_03825 [Gammaproteobacteria bacterium]|nr:MAG: hypothetical protein DRQ47_03825 [Gammaproteobacteria bacterium]